MKALKTVVHHVQMTQAEAKYLALSFYNTNVQYLFQNTGPCIAPLSAGAPHNHPGPNLGCNPNLTLVLHS